MNRVYGDSAKRDGCRRKAESVAVGDEGGMEWRERR